MTIFFGSPELRRKSLCYGLPAMTEATDTFIRTKWKCQTVRRLPPWPMRIGATIAINATVSTPGTCLQKSHLVSSLCPAFQQYCSSHYVLYLIVYGSASPISIVARFRRNPGIRKRKLEIYDATLAWTDRVKFEYMHCTLRSFYLALQFNHFRWGIPQPSFSIERIYATEQVWNWIDHFLFALSSD